MTNVSRARAVGIGSGALLATALRPRSACAQTLSSVHFAASPAATQAEAYYAEQLGFFKQAGITTTQTFVTRGPDALAGVLGGDFDVGSSTPPSIANAIIRGIRIRVIAPGMVYVGNPAPFGLFVLNDSPIHGPRDMDGATVAVQNLNDQQQLGVLAWLDQSRAEASRVKFIEMPFSTMTAALQRGEIAAAFLVEPYASAAKDVTRVIPHVYESLGLRFAVSAWFVRQDYVDKNPALVKATAGALYACARYVNADQSRADALLAAYSKISLDAAHSAVKPVWAEQSEPSNFEPQLRLAVKFKFIPRMISYQELMA